MVSSRDFFFQRFRPGQVLPSFFSISVTGLVFCSAAKITNLLRTQTFSMLVSAYLSLPCFKAEGHLASAL